MNQQKKPFDDKRVRRALTLALDRWEGSKALSRIALVKEVAGIQVPGTPWATPPAELRSWPATADINAARAEARRLLKEAGAENLSFTLPNRAVPQPYEPFGIWLIDQWRQIGVTVKQAPWRRRPGSRCGSGGLRGRHRAVQLDRGAGPRHPLVPHDVTGELRQAQGHGDGRPLLRQSRAMDPEERRKLLRRSRSGSTMRKCTSSRAPVAPHHPHGEGPRLDHHSEPFPELPLDTVWLASSDTVSALGH